MPITVNILVIFVLFFFNAIFAMYEIAMVSSRKARLQQRRDEGSKGAADALALWQDPNQQYLSTVQIMITMIDTLAGGIGGAMLARPVAELFKQVSFLEPIAETVALISVVIVITYFSIVMGELIPKRMAVSMPEEIVTRLSPAIRRLTRLFRPLTRVLSRSTNLGIKILGIKMVSEPIVTEYDIKVMIEQGKETGVFVQAEQEMVSGVFRLADRRVDSLMTPRTEIVWVDVDDEPEKILETLRSSEFYRVPVARGNLDDVIGVLDVKDLVGVNLTSDGFKIEDYIQPALFIPENVSALKALDIFREYGTPNAFVIDEYGGMQGVVTFYGALADIAGAVPVDFSDKDQMAVRRADGSWLLDGLLQIDDLKDTLALDALPGEGNAEFQTLGGFVMSRLGAIPRVGQTFLCRNFRFEVVDMDGRRVDKVLATELLKSEDTDAC